MPAELRTAATVLVLRDTDAAPEVFMVRRHERAAFMAGAYVFPGGAVDVSDRTTADPQWCDGAPDAARRLPDLSPEDALALHVAAVRELFEEAGILLARNEAGALVRFDDARFVRHRHDVHSGARTLRAVMEEEHLRLAADALIVCAHWVTPPLDTRRFDTRFFVTSLPIDQQPVHDDRETTESLWVRAADAIASAERRDIVLPPPTWMMLRELEASATMSAALEWARRMTVRRREPLIAQVDGRRALVMCDGTEGEPTPDASTFLWDGDRWLPRPVR